MFRASKANWFGFKRTGNATGNGFGVRATNNLHHLNHSQQQQVISAINDSVNKRSSPFKTLFQITGIIFATITSYSIYQVGYRKQKTFIPLYISKTKRTPYNFEVDDKVVQTVAEEQLLERLSLDFKIQTQYRLPILLAESSEFDVWIEEKDISIKGLEISPNSPLFKRVEKPIKLNRYLNGIMEPLGGKENEFNIPVVNKNDSRYNIWFLGTVDIKGKNGSEAQIVYKGIFDSEHIKQAKIVKAHLIREVDGKKKREVLWDRL